MNCKLIIPTIEYADEIKAYRTELLEAKSSFAGTQLLKELDNPVEWIESVKSFMNINTVPDSLVEATEFIYVRESDDKIVGMINVRHYLNDYLEKYAGHIGYSVRPSERKKGYAKSMLKEALKYCKEIGINRVLVCCHTDNEASRKTILANGGIFENTVKEQDKDKYIERYWIGNE